MLVIRLFFISTFYHSKVNFLGKYQYIVHDFIDYGFRGDKRNKIRFGFILTLCFFIRFPLDHPQV